MRPVVWSGAVAAAKLGLSRAIYEAELAAVSARRRLDAATQKTSSSMKSKQAMGTTHMGTVGEHEDEDELGNEIGEDDDDDVAAAVAAAATMPPRGSQANRLIAVDLERTVSGVDAAFAETGTLEQLEMKQVLEAYAHYRPSFGYHLFYLMSP